MNNQTAKFKEIANFLRLFCCLFTFSILFMPFAPGLKMTVKSSSGNVVTTYRNAYSFIFSGKLVSEHVTYTTKNYSILGILAFVFFLLSLIAIITSLFLNKKKGKTTKSILLVGLVLLLSASIMMLCMHSSASSILANAITGNASDAVKNTIYKNTTLLFGFVGPGIFGLINCLMIIVSYFFDGTLDEIRATIGNKL